MTERRSPNFRKLLAVSGLLIWMAAPSRIIGEPTPAAVAAYNSYVTAVETRINQQHRSPVTFLQPLASPPGREQRLRREDPIIEQIAAPAGPDLSASERTLDASEEHGFLWRQNTYWSYEERDGGLYLQAESISLSRSVPPGLGWALGPYVESVPRESLEFTLGSARNAIQKSPARETQSERPR